MATYHVYDPETRLFVAGFRGSRKQAAEFAKDFDRPVTVLTEVQARQGFPAKNCGVSPGLFWSKSSKYGVVYRCKVCGKKERGYGQYNHFSNCPLHRG